ncbi:hypothetical protein JCM9140_1418 [Halalkalibacter wakoensis JCM 9140]|uniref:DUF3231 family protein n=1 Tax=Halalkalibacter wakoensis JCM 9140 TaxID=1236970 RepID=W4Q247_9BACI|nr:DUF3231 family protein [Halalkalibacter wakoensis]GAE25424.1 hypothetical protein JCM9140_1418 [Halalkalibacter wakoensis JCM 9140]
MTLEPKITSSELGTLWMTYQQKTMLYSMLQYFIAKAENPESKEIMSNLANGMDTYIKRMKAIFQEEGAVVPEGYSEKDVHIDAPTLYENYFDIHFTRVMKAVSMGMHTLHLGMVYRKDLLTLTQELTSITQQYFIKCTNYLIEKGVLVRPPHVTMPTEIEFATKQDYLKGIKFGEKRSLTTVEVAHLYHAIENNVIGLNLMKGFAQTAQNDDIKKYFTRGIKLSKQLIENFSKVLTKGDIQVPSIEGGTVTTSVVPPFSDKMMMYCTSLLCSFSLGSNAFGTSFSLRNDIPPVVMLGAKDIFDFATDGAKLLVKHGWMEEAPKMEDRKNLINK